MELHTTAIGRGTPRVAYLHGLLGQGKNLATVAKAVSASDPGLLYDLPNHGRSPWTEGFGYASMADAVAADLRDRLGHGTPVTVLGHSMGGKTAMALALRHPDLVRGLVVADISNPDAPAVIANRDTSTFTGSNYEGCWGVYKFPGQPLLLGSDIERGLFVVQVTVP